MPGDEVKALRGFHCRGGRRLPGSEPSQPGHKSLEPTSNMCGHRANVSFTDSLLACEAHSGGWKSASGPGRRPPCLSVPVLTRGLRGPQKAAPQRLRLCCPEDRGSAILTGVRPRTCRGSQWERVCSGSPRGMLGTKGHVVAKTMLSGPTGVLWAGPGCLRFPTQTERRRGSTVPTWLVWACGEGLSVVPNCVLSSTVPSLLGCDMQEFSRMQPHLLRGSLDPVVLGAL